MKTSVEVRVFCPIYKKEQTVYCQILRWKQDRQIVPNGCNDCHNTPSCRECLEKAKLIAQEQLDSLESGDFVFNKP